MIASLHAATGATVGAAVGSRAAAAALGIPLHLLADAVPHGDNASRRFEVGSALLVAALVAARRGVGDAATVGALSACAPDLEHLIRLPRPRGSKLFHDRRGWHRSGRFSTGSQLVLAALLLGRLLAPKAARRAWPAVGSSASSPAGA